MMYKDQVSFDDLNMAAQDRAVTLGQMKAGHGTYREKKGLLLMGKTETSNDQVQSSRTDINWDSNWLDFSLLLRTLPRLVCY